MQTDTAMVLAAGLGTRLRPLTEHTPKPLLKLAGKTMLDHALDHAAAAGARRAVVNVHYLPEQIISHLNDHAELEIIISDERTELLETGGGIKNALDKINREVFFTLNSDVMWQDAPDAAPALRRMMEFWNPEVMDTLLLITPRDTAIGFDGAGDYLMAQDGALQWRGAAAAAPYVYAGATLGKAADFQNYPEKIFSQKRIWDLHEKLGRLFGIVHTGQWYHCSTPADYAAVTRVLA